MYGKKGILAPGYKDGRNKFKGDVYRRKALANLPHKCILCNEKDLSKLDVHHKNGDHENESLSNLVIVCRKCHNNKVHIYKRNKNGRFIGSEINKGVIL